MSREIKFRLRKKDTGKLVCAFQADLILVPDTGQIYNGRLNVTDRYLMEQFTGLHDKNGVEVFEGDILKSGEIGHFPLSVIFNDGAFMVEPLNDLMVNLSQDYINKCFLSVVGSIHQNPELLEA